ncbi:MAG TPA: three-Cys-motif partner protein TcmP [Mycobacteriales bacterium]|nr:three-Cys-motif partner protein TcmP [Mycobacteriales bacterium]
MPTPGDVLEEREPHTEAAHRVYRRYLHTWFPTLLAGFPRGVTYAEGFAGPGEYHGGYPGSPVIALRAALASAPERHPGKPVHLLLVEADNRRLEHLRTVLRVELGNLRPNSLNSSGLVIDLEAGPCERTLPLLLSRHRAENRPLLVVLDTSGEAVAFSLLQQIASTPWPEVIVTVPPGHFARLADDRDQRGGERVLGPAVWRDVQSRHDDQRADYIRTHYRRTVEEAGFRYVLDVELAAQNHGLLHLVYGTNHRRGVEKMKDAMWSVEPVAGIDYRDPRDPDQRGLAVEPAAALNRLLVGYLASRPAGRATVKELREFTLLGTIYKPARTVAAVNALLTEQQIRTVTGGKITAGSVVEAVTVPDAPA